MMALTRREPAKPGWRTAYPAPYKMAAPTRAHGEGPKATPLFHNGKLYTLGVSGIVSAFDATSGKLIWQKPAPAEQPAFGAASSPVGEKDLVIVHPGNYGPLTAFDANTGAVKWKAGDDGAWASPIVADLGGARQVVSMTQDNIAGVFRRPKSASPVEVSWAARGRDADLHADPGRRGDHRNRQLPNGRDKAL